LKRSRIESGATRYDYGHSESDPNSLDSITPIDAGPAKDRQDPELLQQVGYMSTDNVATSEPKPFLSYRQRLPWDHTTYRIRNIPENLDQTKLCQYLVHELGIRDNDIIIHSFALDATRKTDNPSFTATASFRTRPQGLSKNSNVWDFDNSNLSLDTHFLGFTPLSPGNDFSIE
jgi:hypothetical protein